MDPISLAVEMVAVAVKSMSNSILIPIGWVMGLMETLEPGDHLNDSVIEVLEVADMVPDRNSIVPFAN